MTASLDAMGLNTLIISLTPIILAILAYLQKQHNAVSLDLATKTHTLVNSRMGEQLMLCATTARALAVLTQNPVDLAAADAADKKLADHQAKQATVDAAELASK